MGRTYIKWTDDEIVKWAEFYTTHSHVNLAGVEKALGVSHSTAWWCFQHRLEAVDEDLYKQVMDQLEHHKHEYHKGGRPRKKVV